MLPPAPLLSDPYAERVKHVRKAKRVTVAACLNMVYGIYEMYNEDEYRHVDGRAVRP